MKENKITWKAMKKHFGLIAYIGDKKVGRVESRNGLTTAQVYETLELCNTSTFAKGKEAVEFALQTGEPMTDWLNH